MGWSKSADTILDDYNINGRRNQAPFNGVFLALYSYGFVGNILVFMVFRKRYSVPSPYRSLVTLAFSDMFSSFGFFGRCIERTVFVFNQVGSYHINVCKLTRFVCFSNGQASVFLILALGIDRYRKLCVPLHWQMTYTQSKIIGLMSLFFGFLFNSPGMVIFGRQAYFIPEINITATRCGISDELETTIYPLICYGLYVVVILVVISSIGVMQYHIIQSLIQHAKFQKQMRNGTDKPDRSNNVAGTLPNPRQDISARRREIAIALAAITLLMIISFLTLTIYQTYNAYKGFYTPLNQMSLTDDLVNEYIMVDIVAVNGVLNPVVYFVLDLKFRREVKAICSLTTGNV